MTRTVEQVAGQVPMRIRQIALVAADLEQALRDLHDVFAIDVAFRDPGVEVFGLRNGVMPVGEQFLEVVSPKQPATSAGRYLERRRRPDAAPGDASAGDGGYMVIFQTRDLEERRRHLAAQSVRIAWEIAFNDIATLHLHPRDTGGAIVSIDEARPWESWRWAGPKWREHIRTQCVTGIAGVEIQSEDPDALAARWAEILSLQKAATPSTFTVTDAASDDSQWIRFCEATDGRGEGIRTVALRTTDAEAIRRAASSREFAVDEDGAVVVAGTRFALT